MAKFLNSSGLERLVALIKQALGEKKNKDLVVNLTTEDETLVPDKTFTEIYDACDAGKDVLVVLDDSIIYRPTSISSSFIEFSATSADGGDLMFGHLTLNSSNVWTDQSAFAQPELVSGTNIKTINNYSIVGSGNVGLSGADINYSDDDGNYILQGDPINDTLISLDNAVATKQPAKFIVMITRKGARYTYGKTYAEILEAYEAGMDIEVHEGWSYYIYKFANYDEDSGIFAFVADSYSDVLDRYWWTVDSEDDWNTDETLFQLRLISGTTIKTINNQSLLGSGDITISGGNSNISVVTVTGNTPTQQLSPNTFYKFTGSITSITVTLSQESASEVEIFAFSFVAGQDAPTINLPQSVDLAEDPEIKNGDYVEFSIMDNKAICKVWQA